MHEILLATDLDGTLVGDDEALSSLNASLLDLRTANQLRLVYVTGRSPELFEDLKQSKGLLEPDALITAVGTEIYIKGKRLARWPNINDWDEESVRSILSGY